MRKIEKMRPAIKLVPYLISHNLPQVESGDWWVHVKEFYKNTRDMDVLFMKYEDMHADGIDSK